MLSVGIPGHAFAASGYHTDRLAVRAGSSLMMKEGALDAPWATIATSAVNFQLDGDRVGYLDASKNLYVRDDVAGSGWVLVQTGVDEFDLDDDCIVARSGHTLRMKDGPVGASWTTIATDASAFQIDWGWIGYLDVNRNLYVRDYWTGTGWVLEQTGVDRFQIEGDRVAALCGQALRMKEYGVSGWSTIADPVASFQLSGLRVGYLDPDRSFYVRDDSVDSGWILEMGSVDEFQLNEQYIVIRMAQALGLKRGALDSGWETVASGISSFQLDQDRLFYLDAGNNLYASDYAAATGWILEYTNVDAAELCEPVVRPVAFARSDTALGLAAPATCAYARAVLTGSITDPVGGSLASKQVGLFSSQDGSTWTTVTVVPSGSGSFAVSVAPTVTTSYRLVFQGDEVSKPATSAIVFTRPNAVVGRPSVPRTIYSLRRFAVTGPMVPAHQWGTRAVLLRCYRYEGGRWRLKGSYWAAGRGTAYRASLRLRYRGRWRIRAVHYADALNGYAVSSYKYFTVR